MLTKLYSEELATGITKEELCDKYNIKPSAVAHLQPKQSEAIVLQQQPKQTKPIVSEQTEKKFLTRVHTFKEAALTAAITKLQDAYDLDDKELKNIVATVDMLEKSVRKDTTDTPNTVNIMVQNIMSRYADDC